MNGSNGYNGSAVTVDPVPLDNPAIIPEPEEREERKKGRVRAPFNRTVVHPVASIENARTPGERIRKLLAMSGTSMGEFAEMTGIPASSLSSICTDRMRLSVERLRVVADLLGVSEAFIMYGTGAPSTVDVTPSRAITVRAHAEPLPSGNYRIEETARLMGQMPPRVQRAILAFVRTLADAALDGDLA